METRQKQHEGVKQMSDFDIGKLNLSTAEIGILWEAMKITGQCIIKDNLLMMLSDDKSGVIKKWHDNVTKTNYKRLLPFFKELGTGLPLPKDPEDRLQELKGQFKGVTPIMTPGEALNDLCVTAKFAQHLFDNGYLVACNDSVRQVFKELGQSVCDNFHMIHDGLKKTDSYFPPPIVHGISARPGVSVNF